MWVYSHTVLKWLSVLLGEIPEKMGHLGIIVILILLC